MPALPIILSIPSSHAFEYVIEQAKKHGTKREIQRPNQPTQVFRMLGRLRHNGVAHGEEGGRSEGVGDPRPLRNSVYSDGWYALSGCLNITDGMEFGMLIKLRGLVVGRERNGSEVLVQNIRFHTTDLRLTFCDAVI